VLRQQHLRESVVEVDPEAFAGIVVGEFAGQVIETQAAERVAERPGRLVFFDGEEEVGSQLNQDHEP